LNYPCPFVQGHLFEDTVPGILVIDLISAIFMVIPGRSDNTGLQSSRRPHWEAASFTISGDAGSDVKKAVPINVTHQC
jgi:hypothetical protein